MTTGQTIQSLLAKEGIKLTDHDQLNMEPTKKLDSEETITIIELTREKHMMKSFHTIQRRKTTIH